MMKKLILFLFGFMVIFTFLYNKEDKEILIPNNAIRFRIIANSNNFDDQQVKMKIKEEIFNYMIDQNYQNKNRDELISEIKNDHGLNTIISKYTNNYDINYGYNYFPEKTFQGIKYPSGNYESLVITLGDGRGDNWWCLLYPPLCFIDDDNTEYKSLVKEIINNI